MKRLTALLVVIQMTIVISNAQTSQRTTRPIVFDTDTPFVHDPVMAFENGTYYAFYTGQNIGYMTSKNRKTWTVHRDGVLRNIPEWTHDSVPGFNVISGRRILYNGMDVGGWHIAALLLARIPQPSDCFRLHHLRKEIGKMRAVWYRAKEKETTGMLSILIL